MLLSSARLWSLWDMKEILAEGVLSAAAHVERLAVLLKEWETPTPPENMNMDAEVPRDLRRMIAETYDKIAEAADAIGAPITKIAAIRAKKKLLARGKKMLVKDLTPINTEVRSRLQDELGETRFYCLSASCAGYYSPEEPLFGSIVEARLSRAADDISEAGKCFATGRYTASIFHIMRALEAALQEAGTLLGLRKVEIAWGPLLSAVHAKIEVMPKGQARDDWSEIQANLYHVKQAWRNDTMHPKATYTEEEAREVFDAMKAFMRQLASKLPPTVEELMG